VSRFRARITASFREGFRPPPVLTLSQWADSRRKLSPEGSAEPGQWITARAEYQRGIMDAVSDPANEQVVMMLASQVGKSEIVLNTLGFYIDQEPSPILVVQPRVDDAKAFSKDRIAPMLRDTPCLRGKVADARSRDSGNTTLHKTFAGGHVTLGGANSPAGLAMRPIRVVLADEVDRYPASAGTEGDPLSLAVKRTSTFWNRKIIVVSTPTISGASRIAAAFEETDQRRYFVPCPHCNHRQPLWWSNVRWDKDENGRHLPETAAYCCEECGTLWGDGDRWQAVQKGEWRATAESMTGKPGFHLNALYSPWKRLSEYVADWIEAQASPERLKAFINTVLAEVYREKGDAPDWQRLYDRREDWPGNRLPAGALFLTAGVDVQKDRIEARVWAWGRGRQSWLAHSEVMQGDTSRAEVWAALSELLERSWTHASGADLRIARLAIDSGYATAEVYRWARRYVGRVLVVKGAPDGFRQAIGVPSAMEVAGSKRSRTGTKVWPVGSGYIKELTYGWLRLDAPVDGQEYPPGYVHLPRFADDAEIKQLTAEELVTERTKTGFARQVWNKVRERNEALDCRVYAYAAAAQMGMERFSDARWAQFETTLGETGPVAPQPAQTAAVAVAPQPAAAVPGRAVAPPTARNPYTMHVRGGRF
jgi:phage terminase large subunit GpA-like protein